MGRWKSQSEGPGELSLGRVRKCTKCKKAVGRMGGIIAREADRNQFLGGFEDPDTEPRFYSHCKVMLLFLPPRLSFP